MNPLARSGMGGAPKGVVPMVERAIFILAALATIAAFALQAWRAWKDHLERKSEDAEE